MNKSMTKSTSPQVSAPQPIQDILNPNATHAATPAHKEIARLAYQIYIEKGRPLGQNEQILQQAKQEQWYKGLVEMRRANKNNMQFPV